MSFLILTWPEPTLWPNRKAHWRLLNAARARQKKAAYYRMKQGKYRWRKDAHLRFEFRPAARRKFDLDNAMAAMKGAIDGMALASDCDDDGWSYVVARGDKVAGGMVIIRLMGSE